jgi:molecular chaperone GrpE (heat shock protein)
MANDSDLKVNVDLLVESESRLRKLKKEFNNLEARNDDLREHWGSSGITDAMDEFVDNWDDYRKALLENIDVVGKLVKATIDGFTGLDAELAKQLRKGKKK